MFLKLPLLFFLIYQNQYSINSDEYVKNYIDSKSSLLKIDFLVVQNLNIENIDLKEKWRDLESYKFSDELLYIKERPTTLVKLPKKEETEGMYVPKLSINFTKGTSDLKNTSRNLKPQPFLYERLPFQREMKEIEDNLNRSKDYRVLYYNSWYQPVFKQGQSMPIFIESYKKDKKVYGEIAIYKERFIHLDSRVRFSQKTDSYETVKINSNLKDFNQLLEVQKNLKEVKIDNGNYWVETIFNNVKLNLRSLRNFIYFEDQIYFEDPINKPGYLYEDLYEINKDLKLELDEFNFIDHPYFSILIRVSEEVK